MMKEEVIKNDPQMLLQYYGIMAIIESPSSRPRDIASAMKLAGEMAGLYRKRIDIRSQPQINIGDINDLASLIKTLPESDRGKIMKALAGSNPLLEEKGDVDSSEEDYDIQIGSENASGSEEGEPGGDGESY